MGFGVTGTARYVKFASSATAIGLSRQHAGRRASLVSFRAPALRQHLRDAAELRVDVALLTLVTEKKFGVKIIGSITMPLAVVCVILMQLLPSEVRPLVPALQSTWLHVHVTLAMLAYAACAVSFALAMMFLIQDDFQNDTFMAWTSAIVSAIYFAHRRHSLRTRAGFRLRHGMPSTKSDMFLGRGMRLFVTVPDLGWLF